MLGRAPGPSKDIGLYSSEYLQDLVGCKIWWIWWIWWIFCKGVVRERDLSSEQNVCMEVSRGGESRDRDGLGFEKDVCRWEFVRLLDRGFRR